MAEEVCIQLEATEAGAEAELKLSYVAAAAAWTASYDARVRTDQDQPSLHITCYAQVSLLSHRSLAAEEPGGVSR